jgi:prepilin-type N-terminal cleavage/methylation domain-containing protein
MSKLRAGFSIVELLVVFAVLAVVMAIGVPRFDYMRATSNVRSAKLQVTSAVATARATAVRRSRAARVVRTGNQIRVVSDIDTVVPPIALDASYKVTLDVAPTEIGYDARGLAALDSTVKFVLTRGTIRDSVCVTRAGAVMWEGCL